MDVRVGDVYRRRDGYYQRVVQILGSLARVSMCNSSIEGALKAGEYEDELNSFYLIEISTGLCQGYKANYPEDNRTVDFTNCYSRVYEEKFDYPQSFECVAEPLSEAITVMRPLRFVKR